MADQSGLDVLALEIPGLVSIEQLHAEADRIANRARPLCLFYLAGGYEEMSSVYNLLSQIASPPRAYPFVIDRGNGIADYGFASHKWAIDLFEWTRRGTCPDYLMHTILGLLLGYDTESISDHYDKWSGKRFIYAPGEAAIHPKKSRMYRGLDPS